MKSDEINYLIKRYERPLLRFFQRNIVDRAEAEDLTQEALLAIFLAGRRFRGESSHATWVFAIARNILHKFYYKSRYRNLEQRLSEGIPGADKTDLRRLALRYAIEGLSRGERRLYELFYVQRRSVAELARTLNIPEGSAKHRLFALRRTLHGRVHEGR